MSYWKQRAHFDYYKVVKQWVDGLEGESIMDVGGGETPVASWGDFQWRVNVNKDDVVNRVDGVNYVTQDFMEFEHGSKFSVVTCLQVMEHLTDDVVKPFAAKLLAAGGTVIVSVPYMWEAGACEGHLQDPVDEGKFHGWFPVEPGVVQVVAESTDQTCRRIVARFDP